MALSKKSFKPRSRRYRRRRGMRKLKLMRSIPIAKRIHTFRRLGTKSIIYVTGAGAIGSTGYPATDTGLVFSSVSSDSLTGCYQFGLAHNFQLANVVQNSDFTNLYDRYKIVGVSYKLYYHCNDAPVSGLQVLPLVHYSTDNDDAVAPSVASEVSAKGDCKTKILGNRQYIKLWTRPKIAVPAYRSGATSAYDIEKAKWINSSYNDVQHYGVKMWLNQVYMASSNNTAITIEPIYYIQCMDSQ